MNTYVLLFRMDITTKEAQPAAGQMQLYMEQWMAWINDIANRNQLADGGNHLSKEGKLIRSGNVETEGPYTADRESVAGYILILAENMNAAAAIARACPILNGEGTSVEVRQTATPGDMQQVRRTAVS